MLLALKAARDAINPRPGTAGHFLFLGTGSHRALVGELTARRNQAFAGATSQPYPLLDREYVRHVLERLRAEGVEPLPSECRRLSGWPGRLLVTPHQCGTSPCLSARWRSAGDPGVQVSRSVVP
jgi:hypothetical protein